MNPILTIGVSIVNLALLSYTLFFILLIRKRETGKLLFVFLSLGIFFDIVSTVCMIIGSSNGPLTLHGFIGYIALLGMSVDLFLISRFARYNGMEKRISLAIVLASGIFYIYWVLAYITGFILVMI